MPTTHTVRANPDRLPPNWWLDPDYADRVRDQIIRLRADGLGLNEVAAQVGVSQRAVVRTMNRANRGIVRHCAGTTRDGSPCSYLEVNGGDGFCALHAPDMPLRPKRATTGSTRRRGVLCGAILSKRAARANGHVTCHRLTRRPSELCPFHEAEAADMPTGVQREQAILAAERELWDAAARRVERVEVEVQRARLGRDVAYFRWTRAYKRHNAAMQQIEEQAL